MERITFFVFATVCVIFGWFLSSQGPMPLGITATGELLYPQSSGSNDITVLSLGLFSFVITAIYSLVGLALKHRLKYLVYVYLANMVLFTLFVVLVSLDSSILFAAKVGYTFPLSSVVFAYSPVPVAAIFWLIKSDLKF